MSKAEVLQRLPQPLVQTVDWTPPKEEHRPEGGFPGASRETERLEETVEFGGPRASAAQLPSIEGFEIQSELGRGGMAVVYRARQVSLDRVVALKLIRSGRLAEEDDVKRFHAEAEAAAKLDHPGIVPIHQIGVCNGQHYLVMGFVEGASLAAAIADGPLPPRKAAQYVRKVADAVAYAHHQGVIHRDLKPGNVLLDPSGEPRVTDFGLAKRVDSGDSLTASGQVLGTPNYMPPEQASGKIKEVAETADVYSLGATLYALIVGRPPFQAASQVDTLRQVIEQEPVPPRKLNAKIPLDWDTICLKCLEKDRHRRYGSARDLADELQRFLDGAPIHARPVSPLGRLWRWCRRNPRVAIPSAAAATCALALMIGGPTAAVLIHRQKNIADQQRAKAERAQQVAEEAEDLATEQSEIAMRSLMILGRKVQDKLQKAPGEDARALRTDLLNTALAGLNTVSEKGGSKSVISATALRRKGDIYLELGLADRALKVYQQCRDIVESTVNEREQQQKYARRPRILWENRARANDAMGDAYRALKKPNEALEHYRIAMAERQKWLRTEPGYERAEQALAVSLGKLGEWHREAGDYDAALKHFEEALGLRRRSYQRHANDPDNPQATLLSKRELGGALRDLGVVHNRQGRHELAVRYFSEALPLLQQVLDNWSDTLGYQGEYKMEDNVALCYADLGETYLLEGKLEDALEPYGKAVTLFEKLHEEDPAHVAIRRGYFRAAYGLATCELKRDPAAAKKHFETALGVAQKGTAQQMLALARCHKVDEAARLAETFAKKGGRGKMQLYDSACGLALCAWSAKDSGSQQAYQQHAQRAVEMLKAAIAKGYDNVAELKRNPELDALRDLPEFAALLRQVEAAGAPK